MEIYEFEVYTFYIDSMLWRKKTLKAHTSLTVEGNLNIYADVIARLQNVRFPRKTFCNVLLCHYLCVSCNHL